MFVRSFGPLSWCSGVEWCAVVFVADDAAVPTADTDILFEFAFDQLPGRHVAAEFAAEFALTAMQTAGVGAGGVEPAQALGDGAPHEKIFRPCRQMWVFGPVVNNSNCAPMDISIVLM